MKPPSPAKLAREQAGLTVEAVARYCRTTASAIRRREGAGRGWSYYLADRLSRLYGCSIDRFPPDGPTRPLSPSVLRELREREERER
jgi:hypothetical protein